MFECEKIWVFWVGLIVFALACVGVFSALWWLAVTPPSNQDMFVKFMVPPIVGG